MSKTQRSQVKNYQKKSRIIITALFLLWFHTSLKLRPVKGMGQNVNGLQLSGQNMDNISNMIKCTRPTRLFEASSQNHINGISIDEICPPTHVCHLMSFICFHFVVLRYCFMFVYEDRPCFLHRAVCTCLLVANQNFQR